MLTQIINGKILTPQGWLEDGSVLICSIRRRKLSSWLSLFCVLHAGAMSPMGAMPACIGMPSRAWAVQEKQESQKKRQGSKVRRNFVFIRQ